VRLTEFPPDRMPFPLSIQLLQAGGRDVLETRTFADIADSVEAVWNLVLEARRRHEEEARD
jgi:hypothetical protein